MPCLPEAMFKLILDSENVFLNLRMANLSKITNMSILFPLRCKHYFSTSLFVRRIFHLHVK